MLTKRLTNAFRTIYMMGWDAALMGKRNNPYSREDYKRWWRSGFEDCDRGRSLPSFYNEWSRTRAAKRLRGDL